MGYFQDEWAPAHRDRGRPHASREPRPLFRPDARARRAPRGPRGTETRRTVDRARPRRARRRRARARSLARRRARRAGEPRVRPGAGPRNGALVAAGLGAPGPARGARHRLSGRRPGCGRRGHARAPRLARPGGDLARARRWRVAPRDRGRGIPFALCAGPTGGRSAHPVEGARSPPRDGPGGRGDADCGSSFQLRGPERRRSSQLTLPAPPHDPRPSQDLPRSSPSVRAPARLDPPRKGPAPPGRRSRSFDPRRGRDLLGQAPSAPARRGGPVCASRPAAVRDRSSSRRGSPPARTSGGSAATASSSSSAPCSRRA